MTFRRYAADRILSYLGVLLLWLFVVFVIFYGGRAPERFANFLWNLVRHASLGRALETETRGLLEATSVTLSAVAGALLVAVMVGVPLGLLWGSSRNTLARVFVYVAVGLAPVVLGLVLDHHLGSGAGGSRGEGETIGSGYCDLFSPSTKCGGVWDWARHLVLPWLTLGLAFAAFYARTVHALVVRGRRAVADADRDEREAVAARIRSESVIAFGKRLSRDVGVAIGACALVEVVFGLPGLGFGVGPGELVIALLIAFTLDLLVNLVGAAIEPEWRLQ